MQSKGYTVRSATGYIHGHFASHYSARNYAKDRVRIYGGELYVYARESRIETVRA